MEFFARVVDRFGVAFKQHVKATFDRYVHLKHELPIRDDGHRPMNEQFRTTIDQLLLATLDELRIPYHVVQGSIEQRLVTMVELLRPAHRDDGRAGRRPRQRRLRTARHAPGDPTPGEPASARPGVTTPT